MFIQNDPEDGQYAYDHADIERASGCASGIAPELSDIRNKLLSICFRYATGGQFFNHMRVLVSRSASASAEYIRHKQSQFFPAAKAVAKRIIGIQAFCFISFHAVSLDGYICASPYGSFCIFSGGHQAHCCSKHAGGGSDNGNAECNSQMFPLFFPDPDHEITDRNDGCCNAEIVADLRVVGIWQYVCAQCCKREAKPVSLFIRIDQSCEQQREIGDGVHFCNVSRRNDDRVIGCKGECQSAEYADYRSQPE